MTSLSSQHHSFDIALASQYGLECAILIHHFQHWIRINRGAKRNIKENRCWTYQTRKEIKLHFPYWTFEQVRYLCERLVKMGVLITGNFNKNKIDKTLWYAFVDEKAFHVDADFSKNLYERENSPSKGKIPLREGKIPTPIPDTINTYTKPTDIKANKRERALPKSATPPPPTPASHYVGLFDEKILITTEQRSRLVEKYGGMESLVDEYAARLHRHSLKNPKSFKKYARHDLVIEDWIDKDLAKPKEETKPKPQKQLPFTENLKPHQLENFKKNHAIVERLVTEYPAECSGLEFYYKAHVLRDKKSPNFSVSGLIEHRDFCRQLDKHLGSNIEEEVFGNVEFI